MRLDGPSPSPFHSGTYNNQWMIVDYGKLNESPRDLLDGVFTVAEQIPGDVTVVDEVRKINRALSRLFWQAEPLKRVIYRADEEAA